MEIISLAGMTFERIADAFLNAFSDYNISFGRNQLRDMLVRRGADLSLSFGAIDNGQLVSFILNGIGDFNGKRCAYDTGTGTVKTHRGLGLTDGIFTHSLPALRTAGVELYVLEVLTDNTPAIKIYKRQGFETNRQFHCYSAKCETIASAGTAVDIIRANVDDIITQADFSDFNPSWQNSNQSLRRAASNIDIIIARDGEEAVGCAAIEAAYGDLARIAVKPSHRRCGIGTALLNEACRISQTGEIRAVNIPADDEATNCFFKSRGLSLTCSQYEMTKRL